MSLHAIFYQNVWFLKAIDFCNTWLKTTIQKTFIVYYSLIRRNNLSIIIIYFNITFRLC